MAMDLLATDYTLDELPADEVFDIELFKGYKLKLINSSGAEIIDFASWKSKKCS